MTSEQPSIAPFEEILSALRAGEAILLLDDEQRENEGDLVVATERITPAAVQFMMHRARGLVCVSLGHEVAARLNLPLQVLNNNSPFNTPFAVSIDYREMLPYGITARGRAETMRRLLSPQAVAEDFVSPGHVFPLIANEAGVIGRQGQTEGSYDLARIAGLQPSGVICEVLNPDGSMARGAALNEFAMRHQIKLTTIKEIIKYRIGEEVLVREVARATLATDFGPFDTHVFVDDADGKEHLALIRGDPASQEAPLVRIHSECLTGDVFGSRRCDCGWQLHHAMEQIVAEGSGVILYLRQEGRGIGLSNKLRAYELQDQGHDTVEANVRLGFAPDLRDFAIAAKMLSALSIAAVRLMTNNPRKVDTIARCGIKITERVPLIAKADRYSEGYLRTKREKLGHLL